MSNISRCNDDSLDEIFKGTYPDKIECNYLECYAGMGIAGMGNCFLSGNGEKDCPQFVDEKEELERLKNEADEDNFKRNYYLKFPELKCATLDSKNNHCQEPVIHTVEHDGETIHLCSKCYNSWRDKHYKSELVYQLGIIDVDNTQTIKGVKRHIEEDIQKINKKIKRPSFGM